MDSNLSEGQTGQFKEAFSLFDKDGKGTITAKDLSMVMRSLGQNPSQDDLITLIKQFDKDRDGAIDFQQFLQLMQNKMSEGDGKQQLREAFNLMDHKGTGYISLQELRSTLGALGQKLTENKEEVEIGELLDEGDIDGDGKISFEDFYKVMSNR